MAYYVHDDSGVDGEYCGKRLTAWGKCKWCGFTPDMQSTAMVKEAADLTPEEVAAQKKLSDEIIDEIVQEEQEEARAEARIKAADDAMEAYPVLTHENADDFIKFRDVRYHYHCRILGVKS